MLGRVPAQMRDKVLGFLQAELARGPGESAEVRRRHFVSKVSQDSVVQLDDRRWLLGGEKSSGAILVVGVDSGAELTTQCVLHQLHQGLTGEREQWGGTGQQPTCSLAQLETHRTQKLEKICFKL